MSGTVNSVTTNVFGLGAGNPTMIGSSATDVVGFYGATPVVQRATAASHTTIATTLAVSTTSAIWGFSTSTQANAAIAAIAELQAWMVQSGQWAA